MLFYFFPLFGTAKGAERHLMIKLGDRLRRFVSSLSTNVWAKCEPLDLLIVGDSQSGATLSKSYVGIIGTVYQTDSFNRLYLY